MTFDLDATTAAAREAARACAAALRAEAAAIDLAGVLPPAALARAAAVLPPRDQALAWAVAVEELAVASGAIAVGTVGGMLVPSSTGEGPAWAGMRGATSPERRAALAASPVGSLTVAAALVGMGRAVLAEVVPVLRAAREAGAKPEQTEWALADAAAALDGARLVLWRAAQTMGTARDAVTLGMARLLAADAAQQAIAAAKRALPAEAFGAGTVLERVARDIDTAALVFGDVPAHESAVADGVLRA